MFCKSRLCLIFFVLSVCVCMCVCHVFHVVSLNFFRVHGLLFFLSCMLSLIFFCSYHSSFPTKFHVAFINIFFLFPTQSVFVIWQMLQGLIVFVKLADRICYFDQDFCGGTCLPKRTKYVCSYSPRFILENNSSTCVCGR